MAVPATCVATFIVTPRQISGTFSDDPNDIYVGQLYTFTANLPHKCYQISNSFYGGNTFCNRNGDSIIRTRWSQVIAKSTLDDSEIVIFSQKASCHEIDLVSSSFECTCPSGYATIDCACYPCCIANSTIQGLCARLNPNG
jgi:hypothetical protein